MIIELLQSSQKHSIIKKHRALTMQQGSPANIEPGQRNYMIHLSALEGRAHGYYRKEVAHVTCFLTTSEIKSVHIPDLNGYAQSRREVFAITERAEARYH